MAQRTTRADRIAASGRLAGLRSALACEEPGALDALAELSVEAHAAGDAPLAAASAGLVVLAEHVRSLSYRHAPRMLAVLAAIGPNAVGDGAESLLAWAGAAVAHDYGVLPAWPRPDLPLLLEQAQRAPADIALALACALGEVCERNGQDADFAALDAQMAAIELSPLAAPLWRGYWAVTTAWQLASFGKRGEAAIRLEAAQALAAAHRLADLAASVGLQRARLIEWQRDPAKAAALAQAAVARGDAARAPLWWADRADILCRIAMHDSDFHAAVGHARSAAGFLQAAAVWPGFATTYRVNEAYALIGAGAYDEALACLAAAREPPLPRYLAARVCCLADLAVLAAAEQRKLWDETHNVELRSALRQLRELEWPGVLPLLPQYVARLFVRALNGGIEVEWVRAAIRTRKLSAPPGAPENWPWPIMIRTLGSFQLVTAAESDGSREVRKASSKPLELLRFLAAHGHEPVSVELIAVSLWPGDGREGRQKAFDITVARLRRLLASDAAIAVSDRRAHLNAQMVWVDATALDERLAAGEACAEGSPHAVAALEAALALYRGPCLADSRESWALAARERVRTRLAALLLRIARTPGAAAARARELTLRAVAADPDLAPLLERR